MDYVIGRYADGTAELSDLEDLLRVTGEIIHKYKRAMSSPSSSILISGDTPISEIDFPEGK